MPPQIGAVQIKSKAKLINYVFHHLGYIKVEKFYSLACQSPCATFVARQPLFFEKQHTYSSLG